ncbi:MAG: insulinase family protein, partial [Planctomycetota bacterium]|nr:insulinase family protein [Planctomycetota bacterium]
LSEIIPRLLHQPDIRILPLTQIEVDRATTERVQAWIDRLVAEAPIEVSIVGDIEREAAIELARRYFGALPPRNRVAPNLFADLRTLRRAEAPFEARADIDSVAPQAIVLVGCIGADDERARESRILDVAASILAMRLDERLREREAIVSAVGVKHRPGVAYDETGLLMAWAPVDPARAEDVAAAVQRTFEEFSVEGPTPAEVEIARAQLATRAGEMLQDPQHWAAQLATVTYRGEDINRIAGAAAEYLSFTREEVRSAMRRHYAPSSSIRVIVAPAPDAPPMN